MSENKQVMIMLVVMLRGHARGRGRGCGRSLYQTAIPISFLLLLTSSLAFCVCVCGFLGSIQSPSLSGLLEEVDDGLLVPEIGFEGMVRTTVDALGLSVAVLAASELVSIGAGVLVVEEERCGGSCVAACARGSVDSPFVTGIENFVTIW